MSTPRPTQLYDVAVVGSALPGLVAAALLAQRGLRVLHVAEAPVGVYDDAGWRLPTAPQPLPAPRILPAVREVLEELTLAPLVNRALHPIDVQLLLPKARFSPRDEVDRRRALGPAAEAVGAALARLAGQVEETAAAAAGPLLPASAGERFRRWRHARAHRAVATRPLALDGAGPIADALLALHRFAAGDAEAPSALSFARATAPLLHGVHRLPDGGLAAQLVGHVRARRGDALLAKVEELGFERGAFAGLRIRGELWRARTLISALPAARLAELVPDGRRRRRVEAFAAPASAVPLHVRSLVLAAEGVPPGLGPLALAVGNGPAALIQLGPATRTDGTDDPAHRVVTVAAWEDGPTLDALIEEFLPFHDRHVRHRSAPPEAPAAWRIEGERTLGVGGLPMHVPLAGVLHAGPELLPGLGLEGAFLAGRAVARAAQARARQSRGP